MSGTINKIEHTKSATKRIGVTTHVDFSRYKALKQVPARVDSGARTSALWVSHIRADDTMVSFHFFGPSSSYYTGKKVTLPIVRMSDVRSSTGTLQSRYVVQLPIRINKKKIIAKFTLADRSKQTFPILIGRNTLRGNFLVDCSDPGLAASYSDDTEEVEFTESEEV